jgi:hypothetical protein
MPIAINEKIAYITPKIGVCKIGVCNLNNSLGIMKKEELVYLHMLLAQLKKYCEENCVNYDFKKYNDLGISPVQVYRKKEEHKQAIFVLASELVSCQWRIGKPKRL